MALTPMMRQYFEIKERYQDCIVFFRLGDFYEMFFDDAKLASKELELTLTGRDCGQEERAPMCGIPYHSCDGYIQRLIQKGYKVAICEQTEDPSQAKGIVKRDVVRVITPGTLIESQMLDEGQNNFICSVFEGKYYGVTFADISTGEVYITQVSKENGINSLLDELAGFMPKEVIVSQSLENSKELINFFKNKLSCVYSYADETIITKELIEKNVFKRFKNPSNNEKLKSSFSAVCSLCILINYIENMQMGSLELFDYLNFYNESNYMQLGITARMNLEISQTIRTKEKKGTLLWVIDKTKTSMGKRFLKREIERPLLNKTLIENRLDATDIFLKNNILLNETGENLSGIYDIERLLSRIVYGSVNAREIKSLEYTAEKIPVLKKLIENYNTPFLKEIYDDLDSLDDIKALIKSAICENPPISVKDGNIFNKGYNKEIDELRDVLENGKFYLAELEAKEKEKTGIKNLKVSYNKVFGYYFEVTKSYLEMVPDYFIRKQTLVNNERFITEELKNLETKILNANDKITRLEYELFSKLRLLITENLFRIEKTAKSIAKMDFIYSLAKVASENNYSKPEICEENLLIIKDGRHPVVEKF
ncbi:MAG: DNA mismatch repair protein MutS, partial [Clostridia bacterium]